MFEDFNPVEQAHMQLMQALQRKDAGAMETVAASCPQCVQPMAGWQRSPFQDLAGRMYHWDCGENLLECMDVLIRHGASPMQTHAHSPTPFDTLMQHGAVKAFRRMLDMGKLSQWLGGAQPGHALNKLFTRTTWQHYSGDYPIADLTRIFLDAGASVRTYEDKPVLHHLLWTSLPQYGFPTPKGLEQACDLMLAADPTASIGPTQMIQAWRADFRVVAPNLAARYLAQGGSIEALHQSPSIQQMQPNERAEFESWWLQHLTTKTENSPDSGRRMRF